MKICHLTSLHPVYDVRIFKKECLSLAKFGYDVNLIAINAKTEINNGVNIIGVPQTGNNRIKRMIYNVNSVYRKAIEINADVYHLHDPELLRIALKLKRKGKIVIFDSHEDVPQQILGKEWIPLILRRYISYLYKFYEKIVLSKIDALVSVTPSLTDRLKKLNKHTYQITNYPIYEDLRDIRKWKDCIIFSGGISKQWMHKNIIKAIEDINVTYSLMGRPDTNYLSDLKSLKGWEKVDYKGIVPFEKVNIYQQEATIGMALNDYVANVGYKMGTLGNTKFFEYMMAGIPVIATDFIIWKKIIDKYNCGICINPNDISSIKNAIQFLLNNKEEAKEMGNRGKIAIQQEYNWKSQEKILLEMYHNLYKQNN